MHKTSLADLLVKESVAYRTVLTDTEVEVYAEMLGHLSQREVTLALRQHMASGSRFFPTVPEILGYVRRAEIVRGERLTGETAWVLVERAVAGVRPGLTRRIDWPDERSRAVLRGMGLSSYDVAQLEGGRRGTVRKEFIQHYDEAARVADALALDAAIGGRQRPALPSGRTAPDPPAVALQQARERAVAERAAQLEAIEEDRR